MENILILILSLILGWGITTSFNLAERSDKWIKELKEVVKRIK